MCACLIDAGVIEVLEMKKDQLLSCLVGLSKFASVGCHWNAGFELSHPYPPIFMAYKDR
jgi:hypothetical protein